MLGLEEIKGIVLKILEKSFSGNPQKQKIYTSHNRLNFSCPYCGDSDDPRKKRGNLYIDTLSFKCYNGGCGIFKDLIGLVHDFDLKRELTYQQLEQAKNTITLKKSTRRISGKIDVFLLENYKDVIIERTFYKEKLGLLELPPSIKDYLKKRNQVPDEKYLYDPIKKSIHILNLTSDGKYILGLQVRNMKKKASDKYFTYRLSGIHRNLLGNNNPDVISKSEELDPISLVFGLGHVDLESMITCFEGPLDSFLFPNSIGLCSINNPFPFDIENKRWFFDGDKAGREELMKKLREGEMVFLWKKFIEENRLPERDKWDLNDVINYVRSSGIKLTNKIENYFSKDIWDVIYI